MEDGLLLMIIQVVELLHGFFLEHGLLLMIIQVVELLHGFFLYTEHLDSSIQVKPDDDNKMWILEADRTPYHEGLMCTSV